MSTPPPSHDLGKVSSNLARSENNFALNLGPVVVLSGLQDKKNSCVHVSRLKEKLLHFPLFGCFSDVCVLEHAPGDSLWA